jgi:hypothetical protein
MMYGVGEEGYVIWSSIVDAQIWDCILWMRVKMESIWDRRLKDEVLLTRLKFRLSVLHKVGQGLLIPQFRSPPLSPRLLLQIHISSETEGHDLVLHNCSQILISTFEGTST